MLTSAVNLDDPAVYTRYDLADMRGLLQRSPGLLAQGWAAAGGVRLPASYQAVDRIVVHGMGGSAVAGDVLADVLRAEPSAPPLFVHRDYGMPAWVGERTLVIASSASGETQEVLSGLGPALQQGAKVTVVTGGGRLRAAADEAGLPVCLLPTGQPPRTLFNASIGTVLRLLAAAGLTPDRADEVRRAAERLTALQCELDTPVGLSRNRAKALAYALEGRLPLLYGARTLAAVGRRWKTQLNENAKMLALSEDLPEGHHNGVVGLEMRGAPREHLFAVLLQPADAPEALARRFRAMEELLGELDIPFHAVVPPAGASPLEEALSAALLGDYVSYYLALLNGVDPTPTTAIDRLKARVAPTAPERR